MPPVVWDQAHSIWPPSLWFDTCSLEVCCGDFSVIKNDDLKRSNVVDCGGLLENPSKYSGNDRTIFALDGRRCFPGVCVHVLWREKDLCQLIQNEKPRYWPTILDEVLVQGEVS